MSLRGGASVELVSCQGLLWAVPVSIGPEQSLFLLDTGAGITTVDVALADRWGIVSTASFSGRRMNGEVVTIGLAVRSACPPSRVAR